MPGSTAHRAISSACAELQHSDARDLRHVVVPAIMPSILSGCRSSASIALILVVAAEMIGASVGIGAYLLTAGNLMQSEELAAVIVAISVLGLLIGALISWLEHALLSWRWCIRGPKRQFRAAMPKMTLAQP
jgi:ABC-type nitrate/sulfonate/bicarbonate transport system permease component